jgi:curved DNA-binding protein CbpA
LLNILPVPLASARVRGDDADDTRSMTPDAFAIFSLPRSVALDAAALQSAYSALSRTAHPDHGGSEGEASAVNAAYETLRFPDKRLKHLMEIAAPEEAKAWRAVPLDESMMSIFMDLGSALDASAKLLEKKNKASSALAKALLTNEEMALRDRLENIGFALEEKRTGIEAGLGEFDERLASGDDAVWKDIAATQARLTYLAKWQTQIRERLLALM